MYEETEVPPTILQIGYPLFSWEQAREKRNEAELASAASWREIRRLTVLFRSLFPSLDASYIESSTQVRQASQEQVALGLGDIHAESMFLIKCTGFLEKEKCSNGGCRLLFKQMNVVSS